MRLLHHDFDLMKRLPLNQTWIAASLAVAMAVGLTGPGGRGVEAQEVFEPDASGGVFPNVDLSGIGAAMRSDTTEEPVTWTARFERIDAVSGRVAVTATLADTWHIYSTTQPPGGPLKTKLKVVTPEGAEVVGVFTPDRKPKSLVSATYTGLTVEEFEGSVTWTAEVRLPEGYAGPLEVKASGLVCDTIQGRCIPTGETLTVKVSDSEASPAKVIGSNGTGAGASGANARSMAGGNDGSSNTLSPTSPPREIYREDGSVVGWHATLIPDQVEPGQSAVLAITAMPDAPYHVYETATDDSDGSTNFVVTNKDGLRFGGPIADSEVLEKALLPSLPPSRYYEGQVTWKLPVTVPVDAAPGEKTLEGLIAYQACSDSSCLLPKALRFTTTLQVGKQASVSEGSVELTKARNRDVLEQAATLAWVDEMDAGAVIPESEGPGSTADSETGDSKMAVAISGDRDSSLDAPSEDPVVASEVTVSPSGPPGGGSGASAGIASASTGPLSLPWMLMLGFAGGMILNVMPCVLPVISLKVMSFIKQGGEDRSRVLLLNAAYIGGIFLVFACLASLAAFFRFGWGEQFQYFSVRLGAIIALFAFALSYLGVWEIPAPGIASSSGATELQNREGVGGAFAKGVFATLLATPCSAPLLGGVFSALLGAPALTVFAVFFAMAAGMSFPYAVIALFPKASSWLPKPGPWMERFKELMAFLMLGAVAFFFYQFADRNKLPVFITLIGVWFGCWIIGQVPAWKPVGQRIVAALSGVAVATAIGLFAFFGIGGPSQLAWLDYDEKTLDDLQRDGKTVLVDFSAKWCVNCLVNLERAIDTEATAREIERLDAVAVYADWTDHNPAIARKLKELNSNAIPVLAIYPGSRPDQPIILRDLVTQRQVLDALEKAGPSVVPRIASAR